MEKDTEEPKIEKRCFCGRCFHLVTPDDCVEIEGQKFHTLCSMCCICRKTPKSMKMFYGHVFCEDCFKTHVLEHFREGQKVNTHVSWMQWAPWTQRCQAQDKEQDTVPPSEGAASSHSTLKKDLCTRCRKPIEDEKDTVVIAGQNFHSSCAKCCCCQKVPKVQAKLYYGQVFCTDCFHTHILSQRKDNPSEFFRFCFDQFDKNTGFAESMNNFMSSSSKSSKDGPYVFVTPFCKNDGAATAWSAATETKKSRTPSYSMPEDDMLSFWDFSHNNSATTPTSTSVISDLNFDDFNINISNINYSEKIEKLSKFLHKNEETAKTLKKWKNYDVAEILPEEEMPAGWIDLQDMSDKTSKRHVPEEQVECPKCLWQTEHVIM